MKRRWAVQTECQSITGMMLGMKPSVSIEYYRFRWVAKFMIHMTPGYLPYVGGLFSARLLGRITLR